MFADFLYYKNYFKGNKIKSSDDYIHLAQEASRYIKKYTSEVNEDTQDCECALVEYLQVAERQGNIASESIPNAYSVSYNTSSSKKISINEILETYLGAKYTPVGIVTLI